MQSEFFLLFVLFFVNNLTCGGGLRVISRLAPAPQKPTFLRNPSISLRIKLRPDKPVAVKPCSTVDKSIPSWYILYVMENYGI